MSRGQYFRAGAGLVIIDARGLVLVLERADVEGAWQLPQGGLEAGEEPLDAALREANEETGIRARELTFIEAFPEPLAYELPPDARSAKTGRGQVGYWFLFRFTGDDNLIDVHGGGEFRRWMWKPFAELVEQAIDFRKPVYRKLGDHFRRYFGERDP